MSPATATLKPSARLAAPPSFEVPIVRRLKGLRPARAFALPLAFTAGLASLSLLPAVRANARLERSFWIVAALLVVWNLALFARFVATRRTLALDVVLRKQHYLQACAQGSVLLYWGWYWRTVYDAWYLILAQLLFAYAFDILLSWTRRDTYTLGFSVFPVIFSTNLFLWFKPDWFYLQFVMLAVGFAAKELIRWEKDGQRTHIFNPSSFPLGLFSLVLIVTRTTGMTWGPEIAQTIDTVPYIGLWIFLIGLPGQYLFGVTTMTMSAAATVFGVGVLYRWIFGTYFFVDAFIPAAVFLGMHLLFTDPSTSPRTELGRIIFGILYGATVLVLFAAFDRYGAPPFYDKLMAVPILNMTIQLIDRVVRSKRLRPIDPSRIGTAMAPRRRHLAYMSIWAVVFAVIIANDGVGILARGHWVSFWDRACTEGRRGACQVVAKIEAQQCPRGAAWACNELGIRLSESGAVVPGWTAANAFSRACVMGFAAGCRNMLGGPSREGGFQRMPPRPIDYRVLLDEGTGPIRVSNEQQLYELACRQEFADGCYRTGSLHLQSRDVARAIPALDRACEFKSGSACADLAALYERSDLALPDSAKAATYRQRACASGVADSCR
jgi:NQR2/RnfD/RnfE family subunit of NADH-ubiquinone oxidoreductase